MRLHKEIGKDCRRAKQDYINKRCSEIENLERLHHNRDMYREIKRLNPTSRSRCHGPIKSKDNVIVFEHDAVRQRWVEYVEDLYNDNRRNANNLRNIQVINPILEAEVAQAIRQLKNNKACGIDGVPGEFLKVADRIGVKYITMLCNSIYKGGKLPEDFHKSVFVPIPKVAGATDCKQFRTIRLISHAAKVLLTVIL